MVSIDVLRVNTCVAKIAPNKYFRTTSDRIIYRKPATGGLFGVPVFGTNPTVKQFRATDMVDEVSISVAASPIS